jgi:hypothetical protein
MGPVRVVGDAFGGQVLLAGELVDPGGERHDPVLGALAVEGLAWPLAVAGGGLGPGCFHGEEQVPVGHAF